MTDTIPAPVNVKPAAASSAVMSHFFATPIVSAKLPELQALLPELKAAILANKAEEEGVKKSNEGGWHSRSDMLRWGGPAARTLAETAIALAKKVSAFADGEPGDYEWTASMWANVSGPGALNHLHAHPGNLWAAVLYVEAGRGEGGPSARDVGGHIYFEDPRFPMTAMRMSGFRLIGQDGKPQQSQHNHSPSNGELLLFPAWLKHGVRAYTGDVERISIAMNLDVADRSVRAVRQARDSA